MKKHYPLFALLLALAALMIMVTLLRFPAGGILSALPLIGVLVVYGVSGWRFLPRIEPNTRSALITFGLLMGLVYMLEILLEYALLPADNTPYGLAEYGLVFGLTLLAGIMSGWRGRPIKQGVIIGLGSAMIGSILWLVVLLTTFHLFYGSSQQAQVFRAEGNYDDYVRSGMTNFTTFVVQDFYGAGFFHLLLGMFFGALLGTLGGMLGKAAAWGKQKITHQTVTGG